MPQSLTNETQDHWHRVRSHLPPWLDADSTTPMLCHEFNLVIQLSGRGHETGSSRVNTTKAYCILFQNMLVFCQGSIPQVVDETVPLTPTHTTCFGMIFLENLNSEILGEKSNNAVMFTVNLNLGDSISFELQGKSPSIGEQWCSTLKRCLDHVLPSNKTGNATIKVAALLGPADFVGAFQCP